MSHPARGSLQRGGGASFLDGDPTAKAIVGAAIPSASGRGSHPHWVGPLLRRIRRHTHRVGIDVQAIADSCRRDARLPSTDCSEAAE
jgi:hypothetical protein